MTLFEYLSVAVSIVLPLSAAQILSSIRAVLQRERRYWVHTIWIAIAMYVHVVLWWEFWAYRDVVDWTLSKFLLVLVNPGLLFVAANALSTPDSGTTPAWEEHYFSVRRSFFGPFGAMLVISLFRDGLVLDRSLDLARHSPEILVTAICAVGAVSQSRRTHAVLGLIGLCTIAVSTALLWVQPGGGSRF